MMIKFINKKNMYLLLLLVISLVGLVIAPTYAKFPSSYVSDDDVVGMNLAFDVSITNIEEYETVEVKAGKYLQFNVVVQNNSVNTNVLYYGVWYRMNTPTEKTSDIKIAKLEGSANPTTELVKSSVATSVDVTKTVSIIIINDSNSNIKVDIGVASSTVSTADIEYLAGKRLITGVASPPQFAINTPNLDNGNLIPVYFDETYDVWRKADINNTNNSWYDYENKEWANAVMMSPNFIRDDSGNGNNAIMYGGATLDDGWIITDGVDDYVDLGFKNYEFSNGFSFGLEMQFNSLNSFTNRGVIFFGNDQKGGFGLGLDDNDKLNFMIWNSDTSSFSYIYSDFVPIIGELYFIVVTYDNSVAKLYVNGELIGSISVANTYLTSESPLALGGDLVMDSNFEYISSVDGPLALEVSQVLVYDRAFSEAEALNLWNSEDFSAADFDDMLFLHECLLQEDFEVNEVVSNSNGGGVLGFYVWIPRFKYRVWNIAREGGVESTYAYPAFSNGIDIEFESGTESTGNVECTYDHTTTALANVLSDGCYYNGSETVVAPTDSNSSYPDAWYTHPAFTFGDRELEGFWIGKFEISGTEANPTIIPNAKSLGNLKLSNQFISTTKFQNYLSSDLVAHMVTNLEWGAVTYLTHSKYGLCDENGCGGMYINNSTSYYTGRSGGAVPGSTNLNLANVYPSKSTSTAKYNANGYYTYDGYLIDYSGNITTSRDMSKVASTTRNITGVYDMVGGGYDRVMGNQVNYEGGFADAAAGTAWQNTVYYDSTNSTLYLEYTNRYAYSTYNPTGNATTLHRARLGDATAEIMGNTIGSSAGWSVGTAITGGQSLFIWFDYTNKSYFLWFVRGGVANNANASMFAFGYNDGFYDTDIMYRSSLS